MSQIALISDVHLQEDAYDRFSALRWILEQAVAKGVRYLIIAGDFCEESPFPYRQIRGLFLEFPSIYVYILLGNHDYKGAKFSGDFIGLKHIEVIDAPRLIQFENVPFLLLPYQEGKTMSEELFYCVRKWDLKSEEFVLISHGDLLYGDVYYEDEGYFPILVADLKRISPVLSILGHIHSGPHYPDINTYYCGSIYPMNESELGLRYYGLLELASLNLRWIPIDYGPIYWQEKVWLFDEITAEREISKLVEKLGDLFSLRSNWRENLHLKLDVYCLGKVDLSYLEKLLLNMGISSFTLSPVVVLERIEDIDILIGDFISEVESLCASENDIINWGKWKDDIIFSGMKMLQQILRKV